MDLHVPVFKVLTSFRNAFFNGGKSRENCASSPSFWWTSDLDSWFSARLPRFNSWLRNYGFSSETLSILSLRSILRDNLRNLYCGVAVQLLLENGTIIPASTITLFFFLKF